MKPLRIVLITLGLFLVLLVVLIALAFSSGVQTWAARKALAAEPGVSGDIGRLDVGLRHIRAEHVVLRLPEMTLTLPSFEADLSVVGVLRDQLHVRRLVARGWTLDLTASSAAAGEGGVSSPPPAQAALLPFAVALAQTPERESEPGTPRHGLAALRLPVDLSLERIELEGDVVFPAAPASTTGRAQVLLVGGGLAAGRQGAFQVTADARLEDPRSGVSAVTLHSEATARMRTPRSFEQVAMSSLLEATGSRLPEPARLQIEANAGVNEEGTTYVLDLRSPQKSLLQIEAMPVGSGTSDLRGQWRLDLADEDITPFAFGYSLPAFGATGAGRLEVHPDQQGFEAEGQLRVQAGRLEVLHPGLEAVGLVTATTDFEARRVGEDVRLTRLRMTVADRNPIAEVVALQGLEMNLGTGEMRIEDPERDLFEIQLLGLPLAWAQSFVAPHVVSGGAAQGTWIATARDGGVFVRSTQPLRVGGVTVSADGEPLVRDLDLAAALSAEFTPSGWQARIENGHVQSGGIRLLGFDGRGGQAAVAGASLVVTSRFTADVGGWMEQPIAREHQVFQSGRAKGEFIVALSEGKELAAELELADLVAVTGEEVPQLTLKARVDQAADGRIEAHVPLRVTHEGRASDLTLDGQARPTGTGWRLEAVAAGQHVFVQDLQLLTLPLTAGPPGQPEEPSDEDAPPWGRLEGTLSLSIRRLVYNDGLTASNVKGEIRLGADEVRVSDLQAVLDTGGTVGFSGGLSFDVGAAAPYGLQGEFSAADVEVGKFMRAVAPDSTPPVEGIFHLTSTLSGRTHDLSHLASAVAADARMRSAGGTLRALSVEVSNYARTGSSLANVAGMIGSITGDSRTQRYAERFKAATELAQQLSNLPFDQLNIELARKPGEAIIIRDLNLISPAIRLLGSGEIGDQAGLPFWQEPLQMRLQLSARESVAAHLRTLNLLKREPDALGYLPMIEDFQLQGSLTNVTTRQLESLLSRALSGL